MSLLKVCCTQPVTVDSSSSLRDAAYVMRAHHVGFLVVVAAGDPSIPIGVITDRDIVNKAVAEGLDVDSSVENAMSPVVVKINHDASLASAVRRMEISQVRRLVVVDDNGMMCGVISTDDIFQILASEMGSLGQLLHNQVLTENYALFGVPPSLE